MSKTKTFNLIDYVNNLSDLSDNFWDGKLKTDIIHFITREKQIPQDNLTVIKEVKIGAKNLNFVEIS